MSAKAFFDHIGISVREFNACIIFYSSVLSVMGYEIVKQSEGSVGFGIGKKPEFTISSSSGTTCKNHLAFAAPDRSTVDLFYAAAIRAGAVDNGAPGLRLEYHSNYYGAFVLDPDGNNVEAVCHQAQ